MAHERNLVLVYTPQLQAIEDFQTIAADLAVRAPDIEVFIANNNMRNPVSRKRASERPTLVFSPVRLREFQPLRGKIYCGSSLTKLDELRMMREAGISVPTTRVIERGTRLDPSEWGHFTVVKPIGGMQGQGVRLQRTRDVRWVDPESWPHDDSRHGQAMMAQYFVDTGPLTACHRVFAVLGRCAYSATSQALEPRPPLPDPDGDDLLDLPIAANASSRTFTLNYDHEIIGFGEGIAHAFPGVAVLGIDVVREQATGRLFALEVNSPGLTWAISSNYGLVLQTRHGLNLKAQFGALKVIANALIEVTRREAA